MIVSAFCVSGRQEGVIERIERRHGVLSRAIRGRCHVIVANVDQVLIVGSAAQPVLKPHLIDRMLVTAEKDRIRPIICINKIDLVDPADLQPLVGVYGQMGYEVLLLSATTGFGIERLRRKVLGRQSVFAGQSGVGKSSLLNAIDPGLDLRIATVSEENEKGRHTTTVASLIPLSAGGYVLDTPGIRQFQLWDVDSAGGGGLLPRLAILRQLVPFSQLYAHPRGRLFGQGRRSRRPLGRATLRELLPAFCGRPGLKRALFGAPNTRRKVALDRFRQERYACRLICDGCANGPTRPSRFDPSARKR